MDKSALGKGVLSFIIPGIGQYLNEDKQKAVVLFVGMLVLHAIIYYVMNNPFGSLISTIYHAYAGYDAFINHNVKK